MATDAFYEGEPEARELLESLLEVAPKLIPAQAMIGELLVEAGSEREFLTWHKTLPAEADRSPDIWYVRGLWARNQSDLETAADCLWQTVARTPFHRRGFTSLGQVLTTLRHQRAEEIVAYSNLLIRLTQAVDKVLVAEGNAPASVREVAELMEALGRTWEACAWGVVGRQLSPEAKWHSELFARNGSKLTPQLPRIEHEKNPAANLNIEAVPEFARLLDDVRNRLSDSNRPKKLTQATIRFEDSPDIPFQYSMPMTLPQRGLARLSKPAEASGLSTTILTALLTSFFRRVPNGRRGTTNQRHLQSCSTNCSETWPDSDSAT